MSAQPTRHDFVSMIEDLRRAGISHYKLGVMLERQTVQVQRWAAGAQPKHYEGECIIAIHATICGMRSNSVSSAGTSSEIELSNV